MFRSPHFRLATGIDRDRAHIARLAVFNLRSGTAAMLSRACMILCLISAALHAQETLPKKGPDDRFDFEPKLMLDGPDAPALSGTAAPSPEEQVAKCKANLLRAEQRAADAEQLYKDGILAKVEAEARFLRVIQAHKALADAQLAEATARQMAISKAFSSRTASQADLDSANAVLRSAGEAATAADAEWRKAELNAALLDLQRKRKLYNEGAGTLHELQMAEDRVAMLTGTTAP